jgi:hypothetical protein
MKEPGEKGHDSTPSPTLRRLATLGISANVSAHSADKNGTKSGFFLRILIQLEFRDILQASFFC